MQSILADSDTKTREKLCFVFISPKTCEVGMNYDNMMGI